MNFLFKLVIIIFIFPKKISFIELKGTWKVCKHAKPSARGENSHSTSDVQGFNLSIYIANLEHLLLHLAKTFYWQELPSEHSRGFLFAVRFHGKDWLCLRWTGFRKMSIKASHIFHPETVHLDSHKDLQMLLNSTEFFQLYAQHHWTML